MIIAIKFVTCAMMVTLLIVAGCSPNADAPPAETAVEYSTVVEPNISASDTLSSDDQTADSTQAEPSTESVVDAHIRAIGGAEAIAKIKTIHRTGTISGQSRGGPFSGTVEELFDLSGKRGYISEALTGQSEKYGWTEDSGWVSDTEGGVNDMSAEELKNAQLIIRPVSLAAVHATYGAEALSVGGEKEFNGKACMVVTVEGSPIVFCVNQETKLLEGISLPDDVKVTLENYQVIEGVSIPVRAVVKLGAENLTMIYEYNTTDINSEIDATRFQRPSIQQAASTESVPPAGKLTVEQMISYLDKNGDGKISKDEASDELKPHFAAIDTNGDGAIDSSEAQVMVAYANGQQSESIKSVPAAGKPTAEQMISYLDKNGDGKISKDEASDELKPHFAAIDVNGDGSIDSSEAQVMVAYANGQQSESTKSVPASGKLTVEQIISSMDKNGDGKISKDEASEDVKLFFGDIDINGDGAIDSSEAQVMVEYANGQQSGSVESVPEAGKPTVEQIISYLDKNGDGKISKEEASDELKPHFSAIDVNGDGAIDSKEAEVMADYANKESGK